MTNNCLDYALVMERNNELTQEVRSARLGKLRKSRRSFRPRLLNTLAERLFDKSELAHG